MIIFIATKYLQNQLLLYHETCENKPGNYLNVHSLKNDEKYFLFYIKICFHSEDIQIFLLNFWSYGKTTRLES